MKNNIKYFVNIMSHLSWNPMIYVKKRYKQIRGNRKQIDYLSIKNEVLKQYKYYSTI